MKALPFPCIRPAQDRMLEALPQMGGILSSNDALRDAMAEEMRRDDKVFLIGEEVAQYQGAYKVSRELLQEFGERRVIDTTLGLLIFNGVVPQDLGDFALFAVEFTGHTVFQQRDPFAQRGQRGFEFVRDMAQKA